MTSATPTAPDSRLTRLWSYLEADPGNVRLLRDIAREALSTQAYEQALKALDALKDQSHSEGNDEAAAIYALLQLGRVDEACVRGDAARAKWPEDEAVRLEASRALLNARRFSDALEALSASSFSDPALAQMAGELQLQSLWRLGRLDEASEYGLAMSEHWPENPRILALTSAILFDLERTKQAFALAHQAHALSPAHAYQALHVLASECLLKQDLAGALALVDQAQSVRKDDGRIWLIRGSVHMVSGQLDEAVDDLRQALAIFPDHPGSHLTLAWLYIVRQQLTEAEASVQLAIAASPAFAESHGTLAVIQAMKGLRQDAEQSIRRAVLLDKMGFAAKYAQALLDGTPPGRIEELFKRVMMRAGML